MIHESEKKGVLPQLELLIFENLLPGFEFVDGFLHVKLESSGGLEIADGIALKLVQF